MIFFAKDLLENVRKGSFYKKSAYDSDPSEYLAVLGEKKPEVSREPVCDILICSWNSENRLVKFWKSSVKFWKSMWNSKYRLWNSKNHIWNSENRLRNLKIVCEILKIVLVFNITGTLQISGRDFQLSWAKRAASVSPVTSALDPETFRKTILTCVTETFHFYTDQGISFVKNGSEKKLNTFFSIKKIMLQKYFCYQFMSLNIM